MGRPFGDITLYAPTPYSNDSPQYWEETIRKKYAMLQAAQCNSSLHPTWILWYLGSHLEKWINFFDCLRILA